MKKLLGLFFCFGFLLLAGSPALQAQPKIGLTTTYQTSCLDVGKPQLAISTPSTIEVQTFAIDVQRLHVEIKQMAFNTNEALFYRYQFVPACPVNYISKGHGKYYFSYLNYKPLPNKWQSRFNI